MRIKERPEYKTKSKPLSLPGSTSIRDAIKPMAENNYGSVIVINDDETIAGIVTERDFMIRLLHEGKNPDTTTLSDIMTTEVRSAHEDDNVIDWLRIMSNERFRHLPVINNEGKIISMMSQGDFVSYTWPELLESVKSKAKETWGIGHQIIILLLAIIAYPVILNIFG